MKNEVYREADHISLPVPDGTLAGAPLRIGGLNVVTATAKGGGGNLAANATCWLTGGYSLSVTTPGAAGTPVYIITATNVLTSDATGNVLYGHIIEAAVGTTLPVVRLTN